MCTYSISVDDNVLEKVRTVLPNNEAVETWMQSQMDILLQQLAESLTDKTKTQASLSSRLRGIAQAPKDFDYKSELANRVEI